MIMRTLSGQSWPSVSWTSWSCLLHSSCIPGRHPAASRRQILSHSRAWRPSTLAKGWRTTGGQKNKGRSCRHVVSTCGKNVKIELSQTNEIQTYPTTTMNGNRPRRILETQNPSWIGCIQRNSSTAWENSNPHHSFERQNCLDKARCQNKSAGSYSDKEINFSCDTKQPYPASPCVGQSNTSDRAHRW